MTRTHLKITVAVLGTLLTAVVAQSETVSEGLVIRGFNEQIVRVIFKKDQKFFISGCLEPAYLLRDCELYQTPREVKGLSRNLESAIKIHRVPYLWSVEFYQSGVTNSENRLVSTRLEKLETLADLQKRLDGVEELLKDPNLSPERRAQLEKVRDKTRLEITEKTASYDQFIAKLAELVESNKRELAKAQQRLDEFGQTVERELKRPLTALLSGKSGEYSFKHPTLRETAQQFLHDLTLFHWSAPYSLGLVEENGHSSVHYKGFSTRLPKRSERYDLYLRYDVALENCRYRVAGSRRYKIGDQYLEPSFAYGDWSEGKKAVLVFENVESHRSTFSIDVSFDAVYRAKCDFGNVAAVGFMAR